MTNRPWMPLFIADYRRDTMLLEPEEHGVYLLLIMEYWVAGSLPNNEQKLAKICGISRTKFAKISKKIRHFFSVSWTHKRIDQELEKARQISAKRKDSANKRHHPDDANALQLDTHAGASSHSHSHTQRKKKEKSKEIVAVAPAAPKRRPLPPDFELTPELIRLALAEGMQRSQIESEFKDFRSYWQADGRAKVGWDGVWALRCADQVKRQKIAKFKTVTYGDDGMPRYDGSGNGNPTHYGDDGMPRYDG
jgi:uncharacterized protein YdaU (DUF1376 family)